MFEIHASGFDWATIILLSASLVSTQTPAHSPTGRLSIGAQIKLSVYEVFEIQTSGFEKAETLLF